MRCTKCHLTLLFRDETESGMCGTCQRALYVLEPAMYETTSLNVQENKTLEDNVKDASKPTTDNSTKGWNRDVKTAPHNIEVLVQDEKNKVIYAKYDSLWGGGRGAWFDRNNKLVLGVVAYRRDIERYHLETGTPLTR